MRVYCRRRAGAWLEERGRGARGRLGPGRLAREEAVDREGREEVENVEGREEGGAREGREEGEDVEEGQAVMARGGVDVEEAEDMPEEIVGGEEGEEVGGMGQGGPELVVEDIEEEPEMETNGDETCAISVVSQ